MARQIQWVAADGTTLTLTDRVAGYRVLAEATSGLTAPPYRLTTQRYAGVDGVAVQALSADAREVVLGVQIEAPDEATLEQRRADLVRAMRPKAGPGTLVVAREDGTRRTLGCYYTSGLEGSDDRRSGLPGRWWRAAVHLLAADPWFYGDPQSVDVGLAAGGNFFPIFPLVLAPSTVAGQFTIDLSGSDSPAYPLWTITGPGSSLTLTNTTTGRVITVNTSLSAGQSMIIDTRPGQQSVRLGDGTNLMGAVASDPALWPLIEDVNVVAVSLTGATTASRIAGAFQPRYSGA